jgi:hypothetical protein
VYNTGDKLNIAYEEKWIEVDSVEIIFAYGPEATEETTLYKIK